MLNRCLPRIAEIVFALVAVSLHAPIANANKKPPLRPVNLNTATALELQQVPGIGPSTADKILKMRKSYGPFKSVDDLRAIRGIGPKRMEKMRKYITVGKNVAAKNPAGGGAKSSTPPSDSKSPP
jgi:comEA protein